MTKKHIALVLFVAIFILSLGGGIYSATKLPELKEIYLEQKGYAERFKSAYDRATENEDTNSIADKIMNPSTVKTILLDNYKKSQKLADEAKSELNKYYIYSAILVFVAAAMLICTVTTINSISRDKKVLAKLLPDEDSDDDDDDEEDEKKEDKKPKKKSDFDVVLEAPKPSVSEDDE